VVNNLFGVDIMEEAVEICKLRLFLRLVSQVDRVEHVEPLPDIDFNIRSGNALIGFSSRADLRAALSSRLDLEQAAGRIEEATTLADQAFTQFRELQLSEIVADAELATAKRTLQQQLEALRDELDAYLAAQWGRSVSDDGEYRAWCETHLPFHWFVEFHEIMGGEGFDAIIGNPPFVEYSKVRDQYTVQGFETLPCNNLYAFVLERSLELTGGRGRMGMISPLSLVCTARMAPMRKVLGGRDLHVPSFDIRPNPLFEGVTQRLCFVLAAGGSHGAQTWAAGYRRWLSPERPTLLPTEHYTVVDGRCDLAAPMPKFSVNLEKSIRAKLGTGSLEMLVERAAEPIYVHRIVRYFVKALDFVPVFIDAGGNRGRSEDYKEFRFKRGVKPFVLALLNSSLFYWFWRAYSDGFHCGYGDVYLFPHEHVEGAPTERFRDLSARLMDALQANSAEKTISTKRGPIRYQEFYAKPVKPLLDEIDEALAKHYRLSDEELDFILSYDLKYRIGSDDT
jgi:Eco57I restriction-modification methylase